MTSRESPIRMPVLFIGHGSPMNLILKNDFTASLARAALDFPRPEAILVVSAHWLTTGTYVTCDPHPRLIYDFYGFPEKLYRIKYPALGSPEFAREIISRLPRRSVRCGDWGLDHASWAVLKWMYPSADIPTVEMSIDFSQHFSYHYELARDLALFREQGLLIIGSGNIVHNLRVMNPDIDAPPFDWAIEFDNIVKKNLIQHRHDELMNYSNYGRISTLAIPTTDHYLPLIYCIGLQEADEPIAFLHEGIQHGSVSMRCVRFG